VTVPMIEKLFCCAINQWAKRGLLITGHDIMSQVKLNIRVLQLRKIRPCVA